MPVLCFYACPVFSLVLNYREPGAGYWKALKQTKGLSNETPTKVVRPQTLYFVLTSWDTNLSQNVRGMRLGSIATFHYVRGLCVRHVSLRNDTCGDTTGTIAKLKTFVSNLYLASQWLCSTLLNLQTVFMSLENNEMVLYWCLPLPFPLKFVPQEKLVICSLFCFYFGLTSV